MPSLDAPPTSEVSVIPTVDLVPPVTESSTTLEPATDAIGPIQPPIVLDDLLVGGMASYLPVAAAVGVATLTAASIARGVCSPGAAVMFTQVRLVPCVVGSAIERSVMAGTEVVSRRGPGKGSATRRSAPAIVGSIADPIRDGFERVARRPVSEDVDGLRDARLLMQIGIVLGTIYMAFLTVWFWATRVRWNPRV